MLIYNTDVKSVYADIAQSVERILGKDEVTGSNPVISSIENEVPIGCLVFLSSREIITGFEQGVRSSSRTLFTAIKVLIAT